MRTPEVIRLLTSGPEYNQTNEQLTRSAIELALQQLRTDVVNVRDKTDFTASLALRRHQFLLMGASSG